MVSKILIFFVIIGVIVFLTMLILALLVASNGYDRETDDEEQLQYIREYNEKRKLKNAKMSKM